MTNNGWYAIKPNKTKAKHIYLIYMYKKSATLVGLYSNLRGSKSPKMFKNLFLYSERSHQYWNLDGLDSSSYHQFPQSLFVEHLSTVPSAPTTIDISPTRMFHSFLKSSQARFKYSFIISLSYIFILWSNGTEKILLTTSFLFFSFFFFC